MVESIRYFKRSLDCTLFYIIYKLAIFKITFAFYSNTIQVFYRKAKLHYPMLARQPTKNHRTFEQQERLDRYDQLHCDHNSKLLGLVRLRDLHLLK